MFLTKRPSTNSDLWNDFFDFPLSLKSDAAWNPRVDIHEEEGKYVMTTDLPGIKKDEVKINYQDGVLTLSGERKSESEKKDKRFYQSERFYGKFERSFRLNLPIKENEISAALKEGVLTVELPKVEEQKPKQIEVHVA